MSEKPRETLGSRIGFILLSAGCAIGLGNVWRFPYITGKFGGAAFVIMYLLFLVIFGLPIMVAEFAVGRASKKSVAGAFKQLEPEGTKWHWYSFLAVAGNYLLMMFYTVVAGWMLYYFFATISGSLSGLSPDEVGAYFASLRQDPTKLITWMLIVILLGFGVCVMGLQKGVERITKFLMSGLLVIMIGLAIYVAFIPGAGAGYAFYLKPNFKVMAENGLWEAIYAALGQSFFTLSLGIGSMEIFGSYIGKEHSLTGESIRIIGLDTFVALGAGLIIFPACLAFGQNPSSGPGLVLVTLPNIFNSMGLVVGHIIGSLFFLFMSFAALTTVVAVFENIVAFPMDTFGWSRRKSVVFNLFALIILSTPCALGMNKWSNVKLLGLSIDGFEDFLVSNNLLPIGSLIFLGFCTWKFGWGWDNFIAEADAGDGIKFPKSKLMQVYLKYIVPVIIAVIFVAGYIEIFGKK